MCCQLALVANGLFDIFASPVYTISMVRFANKVAATDLANSTLPVLFFALENRRVASAVACGKDGDRVR